MLTALILRNVEVEGRAGLDVRLHGGRVAEIGVGLRGPGQAFDGRGGALIPGLIDHHIHLLATAAQANTLALDQVRSAEELAARVEGWAGARPAGEWVRAAGYHERMAGLLSRADLDRLAPRHPIRVQHQTGSLWMLNSPALDLVVTPDAPACVERDGAGRATGRIWRGDTWLRARIGSAPPSLAPVGARLAAFGVTGVTDASASTDAGSAELLTRAWRAGELPQRLMLMSAEPLEAPADGAFVVGPVKIVLDEHELPALDDMVARIEAARTQGRAVAVHCVTAVELMLTLAAFDEAGSRPGDRVEHGGMIGREAIADIARLGLAVVTQPSFVFERGDRYLDDIDPAEHDDLYRCASLRAVGVPVAASSDAPYASFDPWAAMRAATRRRTRGGRSIGVSEIVSPSVALDMFLGAPDRPGGIVRRVEVGAAADLVLLNAGLRDALEELHAGLVAETFIDGTPCGVGATM
jgi:predicted amidohydrolase YtcJ